MTRNNPRGESMEIRLKILLKWVYLANGDSAFRLSLSISLLFATLVLSVFQAYLLVRLKTAVTN